MTKPIRQSNDYVASLHIDDQMLEALKEVVIEKDGNITMFVYAIPRGDNPLNPVDEKRVEVKFKLLK